MKKVNWGLIVIGAAVFFSGYFFAKLEDTLKEIEHLDKKPFDRLDEEVFEEPDGYTDPFLLRIIPGNGI